ncbi:hypothetical protein QQF64_024492 [Cirrhinus molitorella]|uniref:Glycosyltransferase 2-like domain-containing protein n=1 Tax=Cirrhinus molitorella TaxID=172907 RepID=A0ABR3NLP4_9TELE
MYYSLLFKIFLTSLCVTALGIYAIQSGFLDVTDVTRLLPTGTRRLQFSKERLPGRNIGPYPSKNRSSCSCEGYTLNAQHVPVDELEDLQRRRSEEYRQYQLRMRTKMDSLILAQANSPLQYPIQGFVVQPLTKTVIPGLAVHARKRKLYKVSLSVKKGVLSVEDVLEGDQVEGKGQRELTISSSSLKHLNDLLSRVTYTSTTYHVRTKDLVIFSFEDYESLFSIEIMRPSVPVLYDPGKDINSQVTIATKTFLRYDELNILIESIRQFYPDIKIIIADDSLEPQNVTGYNLEHYIMPPTQGWFAGRNLAISQVTTKYFLWVDDDYIFSNNTQIEKFVEIMEKVPELDVVGGAVGKDQFFFRLKYEEGDEEEGGCLRRLHRRKFQSVPGLDGCFFVDGVVNYFLARTDAVRRVGFDPFLKRVAHTEFFLDGLGDLLIASCKGLTVGHQKKRKQSKYRRFRFPGRKDGKNKLAHHYFKNYLKCISTSHHVVSVKPKLRHFRSANRSSCSNGGMLARPKISEELLKNIVKRRAEEYRQHQIRMGANLDRLLIAPANSPIQYPMTGFTVSPLKKSIIPSLALQTQKRAVYKVSLSVNSGVLSVDDVLDGDHVDGQDQSNMTISSSNLTHLNNLLSRVTYTSTIYHIKTSDFVHFIFEDHEVIFPITIKRQTVPVLYDPGTDVNSQVTIATKTFLRYKELNVLIKSIRMYYPDIKIIIADDSLKPQPVTGKNIEHYIMPPTQGWFAGRNLAISQVATKYFLWVDDDFMFLKGTQIESFVEIMEAVPELDILGGDVSGNQYYFKFEYEEGDEDEGGCLTRIKKGFHQALPNFPNCILVDGVVNYFLGRTDAVRRVGFDPYLKRVGHSEFFMDGLGQLLIASCKGLSIGHQRHKPRGKYAYFRSQKKSEGRRKVYHHFFKNYLKNIKY